MFNASLKPKKAPVQSRKPAAAAKVNEQESKDIMNQLLDDLDGNENLEEFEKTKKQPAIVAYNKDDEMETKYAVAAPTVKSSRPSENPFSKKRPVEEITTKAAAPLENEPVEAPAADEDVEMVEDGAEQIT